MGRLRLLSRAPDVALPAEFAVLLEDEHSPSAEVAMLEALSPALAAAGSLSGVDLCSAVKALLGYELASRLDRECPAALTAPDGSSVRVVYSGAQPTAAAKLQCFFGVLESPTVGPHGAREIVALDLLSPSGKPLVFKHPAQARGGFRTKSTRDILSKSSFSEEQRQQQLSATHSRVRTNTQATTRDLSSLSLSLSRASDHSKAPLRRGVAVFFGQSHKISYSHSLQIRARGGEPTSPNSISLSLSLSLSLRGGT